MTTELMFDEEPDFESYRPKLRHRTGVKRIEVGPTDDLRTVLDKELMVLKKEHEGQLAFLKELVPQVTLLRTILADSVMRMQNDCVDDVYSMKQITKEMQSLEKKLSGYTKVIVKEVEEIPW